MRRILISILALVLLRALDGARSELDEAGLQADVAAIRMGLIEVVAHRETFGGELPRSENPIDWVANRPANYLGEVDGVPAEKIARKRSWRALACCVLRTSNNKT